MSIFNKIKLTRPKRSLHNLSYPMKMSMGYGDLVPIMCEKIVPGDKFRHSHEFLLRMSPFVSQVYQAFDVKVEYFFVPSRILWKDFEKFLVEDDATVYPHPQIPYSVMYDGENTMENTLVDYIEKVSGKPRYDDDGVFHLDAIDGSQLGFGCDAMAYSAMIKTYLDYYADENLFVRESGGNITDFIQLQEMFDELTFTDGTTYGDFVVNMLKIINRASSDETNPREIFKFFKRAYPKDYFTSALPWAQRGPIVQIPLNGSGDVVSSFNGITGERTNWNNVVAHWEAGVTPQDVNVTFHAPSSHSVSSPETSGYLSVSDDQYYTTRVTVGQIPQGMTATQYSDYVKRSPVITFKAINVNGTATITDLRTAFTVQAWLEKNARAGVRYKEQLASHFGVRSRDYRLDRAELLQSSKSHISIGEVFTTAANEDSTFVPGLGVATGTGSAAVKGFKHFFEEHGYLIGFMSVFPKAAYSQGFPRQRLELDKFDYYWPEFQHIGEQEIYNCELYVNDDNPADNKRVFGYTPRYAHYKVRNAEIHGDMVNTLNFMTASRQFTSVPRLNDDFISINPDRDHLYRTFNAVAPMGNALPIQVDFFHHCKALRPMSYFGSPRII